MLFVIITDCFSAHVVRIDYRAYIGFMVSTNIPIDTILTLIVRPMKRFKTVTQGVENLSDFDILPIKKFQILSFEENIHVSF